ncbi:transporter substrate-binding domain-containing protein [Pseudonocardia sp. MCCB 268]|nr:transporter substrate-binding domain-containing protein [Pseudonocardia cytotoxica]
MSGRPARSRLPRRHDRPVLRLRHRREDGRRRPRLRPDQIDWKVVPSAAREDVIERGEGRLPSAPTPSTTKRKQRVGFASPYYTAGRNLCWSQGREPDHRPADPAGQDGLLGDQVDPDPAGQDQADRQRRRVQTYTQCVDQLINGQVDAGFPPTTRPARLHASREPDQLKVVGEPFSEGPPASASPRGDTAFRNKVNGILRGRHQRRHLEADLRRHAGQVRLGRPTRRRSER